METATMTNTMLVKDSFNDFKDGNIPVLLNNLTDNVKWFTPGPKEIMQWGGLHEGREAVAKFFQILDKEVEFLNFEPKEFIEQGNKVVALGFMESKSKRTGKTSKSDWAMVFTLRNGKITHFKEYSDTYEAVKAFQ